MTPVREWRIPRPVWMVLMSWGAAVLVISMLLSAWIWTNQRHAEQMRERSQRESNRAMCVMLDLFMSGPPPVSGPAGDRGRAVLAAMDVYQRTLHCDSLPR